MYDWLSDALQGPATVITANRRLARVLQREYAGQQQRQGLSAWQSPAIYAWPDWLLHTVQTSTDQASLPTHLNIHQSRLLWERCLAREFEYDASAISNLVRLSRDAWQRLADWRISIGELAQSVQNDDQRLFASVAGRYLGILEREYWVDDAGLAALACELIENGDAPVPGRFTFAGFDRARPAVSAVEEALSRKGCDVQIAGGRNAASDIGLVGYENSEAELRAAGNWARQRLLREPARQVAIIALNLEQQADRKARLVREGFAPGWQFADIPAAQTVNVSYGRKLAEYPAISIALLLLRWLERDLGASDVGQLLRSPLLAAGESAGRSRLELRLRQLPDRAWSPSMISASLRSERGDTSAWRSLVASLSKWRREVPRIASPGAWALFVDKTLKTCRWPGEHSLSSFDFQLVNRWRDLLNEFARLDLVDPRMTLARALQRIEQMTGDTVFQPESEGAALQLLGPLEASGAEFDAVWITGVTAANWPPAGNPSPLLSRRLQRQKGMPDAEPADTLAYAENLLRNLGHCADEVVCSYPLQEDDAEQSPSDLLRCLDAVRIDSHDDPGWHASRMIQKPRSVAVNDRVPAVLADEAISGGAGTIQRQLNEPIAAFVTGRLGVRILQPQATGIPASMRGNIVHDTLHELYRDRPSRSDIASWNDRQLEQKLEHALHESFARHERNTDPVLFELLRLERQRVKRLLHRFVSADSSRGDFEIASVEQQVDFRSAAVRMTLRVDRIDRMADGSLSILDYKTGARKNFLRRDGQPVEIQLVAYAGALEEPVSSLALAFVDGRDAPFSGAGWGYTDEGEWPALLSGWQQMVSIACDDMSRGDVRINNTLGTREARNLNLISRYSELCRDA